MSAYAVMPLDVAVKNIVNDGELFTSDDAKALAVVTLIADHDGMDLEKLGPLQGAKLIAKATMMITKAKRGM